MNIQLIVKAAVETSLYYREVKQDDKLADAFLMFANALIDQEWKKKHREDLEHTIAIRDAMGDHGQG